MHRMSVTYHVRCDADQIEARAQAIAIEQSVEMPVAAIEDDIVLRDIVGQVDAIRELKQGLFEVRLKLSSATIGNDAGQLMNMLFGNSSIHDDITLYDVDIDDHLTNIFRGPHHGIDDIRTRSNAQNRALTCSALKPQGLSAKGLADLAYRLALGGIDYIKDDHGLADQSYSPFAERVLLCAEAVRKANRETGHVTRYAPNLSGDLDMMRQQIEIAIEEGIDTVLIEPMIAGLSNFYRLVKDYPSIAFMAHPALAGASSMSPPLLLGKLFRLLGASFTVYPNYGGRFGYSKETCLEIASSARGYMLSVKTCLPCPAGGMTLDRIPELLDFYGRDTMLLIGGHLLSAKDRLVQETTAFVRRVEDHVYSVTYE